MYFENTVRKDLNLIWYLDYRNQQKIRINKCDFSN